MRLVAGILCLVFACAPLRARAEEEADPKLARQAEPVAPSPIPSPSPSPIPSPEPSPSPAPATTAQVTTEKVARPKKAYAFAVGGAALAAFAIGGALGGVAKSRSDEQEGNTLSPPLYTKDLADRGTEGRGLATGAYVCFGLGGVLAAVDIFLWIEALRK